MPGRLCGKGMGPAFFVWGRAKAARRVGLAKGIVYHKRSTARRMPEYGRKKQKGKCCYEGTKNHGAAGHCGKTEGLF